MSPSKEQIHNRLAPYWAAGIIILGFCGLSTIWFEWGDFWKGYVLDICGPAWNYILFRGLFTTYQENSWTKLFTPVRTLVLFLLFCFGVEGAQYLELYESTFDPWDLLAYISLLIPLFVLDILLNKNEKLNPDINTVNSDGEL